MDERDLDFSKHEALAELNSSEDFTWDWDSFLDNTLEVHNQHHSCIHTHTCNPPGPELPHTHTCLHVHTRILPAPADESAEKCPSAKKRPSGNKEAVRKYREKKKAHTVSLEEELIKLKMINQQLMKRLGNQAALQAEVNRLKCLLVDLKGRIEGEIGSFPYQSHAKADGDTFPSGAAHANVSSGTRVLNSCGFHCDDQVYCFGPEMQTKSRGENQSFSGQQFGACDFAILPCMGDSISGSAEVLD